MKVVIDADVLIGALDGSDAHHAAARKLFTRWRRAGDQPAISLVNLTDVLVAPAVERPKLAAAREAISALGLAVERPTVGVAVEAARLRGRHPVSLADAYGLATAKELKVPVASFDRRFVAAAEAEGLKVQTSPAR